MRTGHGAWTFAVRCLAFVFLLGMAVPVLAGDMSCTGRSESSGDDGNYTNDFDFGDGVQDDVGVIDGNDPATVALINTVSTLVLDGDCTIKNFTQSNPFPVGNINFWTPNQGTKPAYLIVFDNVYYEGNMACANIPHKLWLTNGTVFNISNSCQDYFIPVEKIDKQVPGPTASIGVPFIYTLNIPVLYDPATGSVFNASGSPNPLGNIHVTDDLTALGTGAEMTLAGPITYYWQGAPGTIFTVTNNGDSKHLDFVLPDTPANGQIVVRIPVVLDAGNVPGTVFTNTAKWEFSRFISMDVNGDGVTAPGEGRFFNPLPGEWGISAPMTITGPDFVLTKSTPSTAVNASNIITYTIDAQNTGGWEAWNVTLQDILPDNTNPASTPAKGMCETDPVTFGSGLTAKIVQSDGITLVRNLSAGTDYAASWGGTSGPNACELAVTLTDAGGAIAPNQRLMVTYQTRLDTAFTLGGTGTLTNVAGAMQWFNGASTVGGRVGFTRTPSNGTPGTADFQDDASVTVAVSGYYFEKTVTNLATGVNPATTAAPGDSLRYRLHLFNVNQNITDITISDLLGAGNFVLPPSNITCSVMGPVTVPDTLTTTMTPACSFSAGALQVVGAGGKNLLLPQGDDLVVEFDVALQGSLGNGTIVSNQATLNAVGITSQAAPYLSDDPNDASGVADPTVVGDEAPTIVTVVAPGPLFKANPAATNVVVGQQFSYQITVPATAVAMPLYDVHVLDTLPANLRFVSATAQVGASTLTLLDTNNGTDNNLDLREPATGLDIPAGQSAVVTLTVAVVGDAINQGGTTFTNAATYTYSRINGGSTAVPGSGNTTPAMTVLEPVLTIGKTVSNISAPGNPAMGGDVLEYVVTIPNSGNATAFDTNVSDTLPPELVLDAGFAPTATINGTPVAGFNPTPTVVVGGTLAWGNGNGDDRLDVPVGGTLVLTYRATVVNVTGGNLVNSAFADWTSLNGVVTGERTGAGCPTFAAPDDYCTGPATVSIATLDTTAFAKANVSDSWSTAPSTGTDKTLRVGDTATYSLTLSLREGQTHGVVVTDALPAGMALDSFTITNGANITYALAASPAAGATGTLTWSFGTVTNAPDSNAANDQLVIQYVARVVANSVGTIAQAAATLLTNNAQLAYTGAAAALPGTDSIDVRQPVMSDLAKTGTGSTIAGGNGSQVTPYLVNLASSVMQFHLETCNAVNPAAPAYGVVIRDTLAAQFDEASISNVVVMVGGVPATYTSNLPIARNGTLTFTLSTPVNPGQCATVDYQIGFHTDVTTTTAWSNVAGLTDYWSLPAGMGQHYSNATTDQVWMQNVATPLPPVKALAPVITEATIGQAVTYTITVPADNLIRNNVVITDTLSPNLVYDGATVAGAFTMTDSLAGQVVSLTIAQIPAGQQAVITLNTHVANIATTNAGNVFSNQASYTYGGYTGPALLSAPTASLTLVEPLVTVTKAVTPTTPPVAGNILHYTVDLAASTGALFSGAYDLGLVDTLSLGLAYMPGTATVGGVAVEPAVSGDGVSVPQTLTWTGVDIPEGTAVAVAYDVRVLNGVTPSQNLSNSVTARWTSLDGGNANERNGTGSPAHNDYFASASTSLGAPDNTTLAKSRLSDTFNAGDASVRIGDRADYELRLGLQEGTHNNLVLSDTLPAGMVFDSVVSATIFGTAGTANPSVSGQTLTWNLGTLINPADGNPANDFVVIVYRARVLNNDALAQTPTTQTLANNASLAYTIGGVPVLPKTASQAITVLQPNLVLSKSAAPAGGDSVVVAGEAISYTVDITNNGAAPAYDTVLTDTLPAGLRQGGVTTTSISLVSGTVLPVLAPAYSPVTGVATWNFDNGTANTYTIPAGDTLRVIYTVQADANVGASLSLSNTATASLYYSFDDEAVPAGGATGEREVYGPSLAVIATLTTPAPGALQKAATQTTATIGEQFTYRITVPAVPVSTTLHDVRITDDLDASAADLRFVSVAKVAGSGGWTPVNTGNTAQLVIEDTGTGIDIPAGEQVTVEVTVELLNTASNVSGLVFSNAADYTYNRVANTPATQAAGLPGTSGNMTITGPDALTLNKSGPATMRYGTPGTFTLDVQNTGTATAWDITVTDLLPNPTPGGMCGTTPTVLSARVVAADGVTLVSTLAAINDFSTLFTAGTPTCSLAFTGLSAAAALQPTQRLIVTYQADLDADNPANASLTNVAAVTQWFSQDTAGAGATGETRAFSRTLTNGSVGTVDHEDAHTLTTEPPTMVVAKSVFNVTTGQTGATARPGDRLRYSIRVTNTDLVPLPNFSLRDDVGALNAAAVFVPGSLSLTTVPAGADTTATNANGGTNSAGLVDIGNLVLGPQGSATETVLVEFEVTLAPVITSGTVVLNQGALSAFGSTLDITDDPNVNGADDSDEDPTRSLISSAPQWQVRKRSDDRTGDVNVLQAGDTLRYTLMVENNGNENATGVVLRDLIPAYTTYLANTTTLNGIAVTDASAGVSPLQGGMLINAPGNTTAGAMNADASATVTTTANVATVTFDVRVNSNVLEGTIIANQGFVNGTGAGGIFFSEQPSDDPDVNGLDDPAIMGDEDPTRDIVGSLPLLDAQKTVAIVVDATTSDVVDPGDVLRYTLTVNNYGAVAATGVRLSDTVPANTTYVANSVRLNGVAVADAGAGVSPLIAGILINSAGAGSGNIVAGASAEIVFDVQVNAGVAADTVISNQGFVESVGLPVEPTDADGLDANGDQPTTIVVGSAQQVLITKEVFVVGGGAALPGSQLEYVVRVTNTGTVAATQVVLTDDLGALGGQASYVAGSATLNGLSAGVSYVAPVLTGDYAGTYGNLLPGASATLRFRVLVSGTLPIGTTISNTGDVSWNTPTLSASSTVTMDTGAIPGSATLSGHVWHDANFSNVFDSTERNLSGWTVDLYRSNSLLGSTTTDAGGLFQFGGVAATTSVADQYELRFTAPGASASTAKLGLADSAFSNGLQRISGITATSGGNILNLNLPIDPNGVVYDSIVRAPVAGAKLTMVQAGSNTPLASSCFDDPAQQNQVTLAAGFYKFDVNFSDASCVAGGDYEIRVTPPATGYMAGPSRIIPAISSASTAAYAVASCAADAVSTPVGYCEAQGSESAPALSVPARTAGTNHYLHLTLGNAAMPGDSQMFNNHIAIDPTLDNALSISKKSALVNVSRGQIVPYVITVSNTLAVPLQDMSIVDTFPVGFKYVAGSSRVDGKPVEPVMSNRQLRWDNLQFNTNSVRTIKMLFIVGSGVGEGDYINRAQVINAVTTSAASAEATATVRVVPDPTFDCTDIIGKVFDDANLNGVQDAGEKGLPGVRIASARGLLVKTDDHGRFHLTCAVTPDEARGSNFILKVDDRTLPTGYRMTTENPRVLRATRGKMMKFNFGATLHKVVRIDMANGVFEPGTTGMRLQWTTRMSLLMRELKKGPSILRVAYLAEVEDEGLVQERLNSVKKEIARLWAEQEQPYELTVETEVFWRTGAPPERSKSK